MVEDEYIMCKVKCHECEAEIEEETIINCPVYGKTCPICGNNFMNSELQSNSILISQ